MAITINAKPIRKVPSAPENIINNPRGIPINRQYLAVSLSTTRY